MYHESWHIDDLTYPQIKFWRERAFTSQYVSHNHTQMHIHKKKKTKKKQACSRQILWDAKHKRNMFPVYLRISLAYACADHSLHESWHMYHESWHVFTRRTLARARVYLRTSLAYAWVLCAYYWYVWHDSVMCVTWLIHVCDVTYSWVWHDSFMCVSWLIHMRDVTHS